MGLHSDGMCGSCGTLHERNLGIEVIANPINDNGGLTAKMSCSTLGSSKRRPDWKTFDGFARRPLGQVYVPPDWQEGPNHASFGGETSTK